MSSAFQISEYEIVCAIADAIDLMSPIVSNHHKRVAFIASALAQIGDIPAKQQQELIIAGLLHDIGAYSVQHRAELHEFDNKDTSLHCELGYHFLKEYPPFENVAEIVRFHHRRWKNGSDQKIDGKNVNELAHLLHLADRIAIMINQYEDIDLQIPRILNIIQNEAGLMFKPEHVDWFKNLAIDQQFWHTLNDENFETVVNNHISHAKEEIELDQFIQFSRIISHMIDFKNHYAATHSVGVAQVATDLAHLLNLSEQESKLIAIAGYLHDLGTLAVPAEDLKHSGETHLREDKLNRRYTFYTKQIVDRIDWLHNVKAYADMRHSIDNDKQFPYNLGGDDHSIASRILALADVYSAFKEYRPERDEVSHDDLSKYLSGMIFSGQLDPRLVELLMANIDSIEQHRKSAEDSAMSYYKEYLKIAQQEKN